MCYYSTSYSKDETQIFIDKNMNRYQSIDCGLWTIILNATQKVIGDCGITIQNIDCIEECEIGYHLNKKCWENDYATETAIAVKDYGFNEMGFDKLCSYMAADHWPSRKVAEQNDMKFEKSFNNLRNRNLLTVVYSINNSNQ